jgi:hypothetical protein
MAVIFLGLGVLHSEGVVTVGLALGAALAVNVLVGYPLYRRRGRLPNF